MDGEDCESKRVNVYLFSLLGLVIGITGIYQIKISRSLIEDMPKKAEFLKIFYFLIKTLMELSL